MKRIAFVLALPMLFSAFGMAQVAGNANDGYKTKEGREKVAKGLADPARDKTQKPDVVAAALGIKPGMVVADIGTGIGYMLPYLSKSVGPGGKVLAEDIETDFLDKAKVKVSDEKLSNVTLVLGSDVDPKLPLNAVDLELILDVYHHFEYPDKMLANLKSSLKANGRLIIVEYYQKEVAPGHIRLDAAGLINEVEANGFRLSEKNDHITERQFMLTFVKK
jgi:ubiquinone/menaquinone biosynthesis C-methylase UbiE